VMMIKRYWRKKTVLISGFEGFLGSHLSKKMISLGAKVLGIDIKVRRKETILAPDDYKKIRVIKGNVTNYKLLEGTIKRYRVNVVFHLAAEAIVGKCKDAPLKTFATNIEGTWNILEACRNSKTIQSLIIASSDKAYGSHKKLPYSEEATLIGSHPYDVSKSCADLIAQAYSHTYGLAVAITRCGNIYGPGDFNFSRIIPDAIRCALSEKTLLIRSDGKFTRDYVFVEDVVNGYILLAEKLQELKLGGGAFNFSNESPISVIGLVKQIFPAAHKKPNYRILNKAKYEIREQYLSAKKARRILNWKPKHNLASGLEKTINWYALNQRIL